MVLLLKREITLKQVKQCIRLVAEVLNILISSEETALYLAKKFGVPDTLIRDEDERQQLVQLAQQVQQQGAMPDATTLGG